MSRVSPELLYAVPGIASKKPRASPASALPNSLMNNERHPLLSAYAENHGREPENECVGRTLHSSKSEGG